MAGLAVAVVVLAAAMLGPTMLAGAQSGYQLTVNVTGNGTVNDAAGTINCPPTCTHTYALNTTVSLYAYPGGSDTFEGWSGACQGTTKCAVTMDADQTVGAAFSGAAPSPTPSPTATPTPQPTATPTPQPSPTPSPSGSAVVLELSGVAIQSLRHTHGTIRIRLRCSLQCLAAVKGTLRLPNAKSKAALPTVKIALPAAQTTAVPIKLPLKLRLAIRRRASAKHPARARLVASAADGALVATPQRLLVKLTP
jgi:Divergent InlB B-repeat domain